MARLNSQSDSQSHREDLAGEYKHGDAGQVVIAILFGLAWIADSFFLKYTTFLNEYVPNSIRLPLGLVFFAVSAFLAGKSHSIVFHEKREAAGVIKKSVFGIVRHPMYLSEILVYFGFLILSLSLAAVVVWVIAILFLHYISRYEEKLLLARFGEEYAQYMREVPMWIPSVRKRK